MADFTALKTAIQNAIKQNGNEEITGNILQDVLLAIVTTLGDGSINDLITALGSEATTREQADGTLQQNINAEAQARQLADSTLQGGINTAMQAINAINNAIGNGCVYAGIATPSSTPASGKVFYLALTAGTYTNYGGLEVSQGINILKNNGSTWLLDSFLGIDDAPTPSSNNLVKSGGVFNDIMTNGSAFDLTAYNNGTTYADLNAALTALNALPADFKKGGMSMKYVQTYDNKYVQYRYTLSSINDTDFCNINNWEGGKSVEQDVAELSFMPTEVLTPTATVDNWKLTDNGLCSSDSSYMIVKYFVNEGDVLRLIISKDSSGVMQFQSAASVPSSGTNSNLIGYPYTSSINRMVKVPANATYLIISQLKTNTTNVVSKMVGTDDAPAFESNNLVRSGGVDARLTPIDGGEKVTFEKTENGNWGWDIFHKFKANVEYEVFNYNNSYTSLYFYNSSNQSIGGTSNLPRNSVTKFTLSEDAVRVSGYHSGTNSNFVKLEIKQSSYLIKDVEQIAERTDSLELGLSKQQEDFATIVKFEETLDISQSGNNWTYLINIPIGSYRLDAITTEKTSVNIYDKDDNVIFYSSNFGGTSFRSIGATLEKDAVKISGYRGTAGANLKFTISRLGTHEERINDIEEPTDIVLLNPPCIYDNLINNICKGNNAISSSKLVTLLHFSDVHGASYNIDRLLKFSKRYTSKIDDIICTGDIVIDQFTQPNVLDDYPEILSVLGNHDAWIRTYDEDIAERQEGENSLWVVKQKECYDKFFATNIGNWDVTQPTNASSLGKCYYYKDYTIGTNSLRMIVIDCMHYNVGADLDGNVSIQNTWLEETLNSAKANNIPVVVVSHYWPTWVSANNQEVIKCSYTDTDRIASDYLPDIAISTVQSFIDNGGEFVCWVVGHSHYDLIAAPRNYPKQMFISIDCANSVTSSQNNSERIVGTKSQDCFNIISFDTSEKLVKVVRVGSDVTRTLETKRRLVYRYADYTDSIGVVHNRGLELSY